MSKIIGVTVGTPIGVDKIKEKIKPVTSVNGVKADESGNVEVQIENGGASSWNELTDKPFDENNVIKREALPEGYPYKSGMTIEWDGNKDGPGTMGNGFVKVSDVTLTKEQLIGATVKIECPQMPSMNFSLVIVASDISEENGVLYVAPEMAGAVIIRCAENAVYFFSQEIGPGSFLHTSSLVTETIHAIAPEYLKLGNGLTVDENGAIALSLPTWTGGSY